MAFSPYPNIELKANFNNEEILIESSNLKKDEYNTKTRNINKINSNNNKNNTSKNFTIPLSTLGSKENTLFNEMNPDEENFKNLQKNKSFLDENSDSDINKINMLESKTNDPKESNKSKNEIYENIIQIVANLNQKNALSNIDENKNFNNEEEIDSIKRSNNLEHNKNNIKNSIIINDNYNNFNIKNYSNYNAFEDEDNIYNSNPNLITEINNIEVNQNLNGQRKDNIESNKLYFNQFKNNESKVENSEGI